MVDADRGIGRLLIATREDPAFQRGAVMVAVLILVISFALAYATRTLHFFGLSFVAISVLAWLGGWRIGVLSGLAIPIFSLPIPFATGYPPEVVLLDTSTFLFMALVCGGAVGLLSSLFKYAVSTQREIRLLHRILPICSHCHRVRQDDEEWLSLEAYFDAYSEIQLSHGICPHCLRNHYGD